MAIDRNLLGQVKQACLNAKRAGFDLGLIKLAFRGRGQPIFQRPVFQRRQQPVYQQPQYQAPAPQQAPLGAPQMGPLPSYEGNQASSDAYKQAPAGMQRFRNSATGEVFYAPNGQVANQYTAGGDAAALGIKPGERAGSQEPSAAQTVAEQASARDQELFSGPAAGTDSAEMSSQVGNTGTQYDTFKGYDDRTGAHAPQNMDTAIEESKRIRAADPRNQIQTPPASAPAPAPAPAPARASAPDYGIPLRPAPEFKPLSGGPLQAMSNAASNVGTAASFVGGNMADQGARNVVRAINSPIASAVGKATGGMGPGGYSYNRNAPGRAATPTPPQMPADYKPMPEINTGG